MVKPIPSRFNPDLLVRDTTQHSLKLPLGQFSRLRAYLFDDQAVIDATELSAVFRFSRRRSTVLVAGRLSTSYLLECQRCLGSMTHLVDEPFELAFAKTAEAAEEMPEGLDPVVLDDDGQIHVVDLFEDELILHLPTVALHTDLGECDTDFIQDKATVEKNELERKVRKNPFDVLKNLDLN